MRVVVGSIGIDFQSSNTTHATVEIWHLRIAGLELILKSVVGKGNENKYPRPKSIDVVKSR